MVTDIWKLCWYQCSKETSPGRLSTGHRWNVGLRPLGSPSEESTCPSCAWHPRIHPGHSFPIRTKCNYFEWSMFQSRQWYLFQASKKWKWYDCYFVFFFDTRPGDKFSSRQLVLNPYQKSGRLAISFQYQFLSCHYSWTTWPKMSCILGFYEKNVI